MSKRVTFNDHITRLIGAEEASQLMEAINLFAPKAVRYHAQKFSPESLSGEPVPWYPSHGRYWQERENPSQSYDYLTGGFYIQEASAMLLVSALSNVVNLRDLRIADLTAAPGGKATHVAELAPEGLVLANEVIRGRTDALMWNVIRHRLRNVIVSNMQLGEIASSLSGWFDVAIVDAPCSGEGLFQKKKHNPKAWNHKNVIFNATRQRAILGDAMRILKPGGILAYSTCTFGVEENEYQVASLLENGFEPIDFPSLEGVSPAISEDDSIARCSRRLFPHRQKAAGAFAALVRKVEGEAPMDVRMVACEDKKLEKRLPDIMNMDEDVHLYRSGAVINALNREEIPRVLYEKAIQIGAAIFTEQLVPEPMHGSVLVADDAHCITLGGQQLMNYRQGSNLHFDVADGFYYAKHNEDVLGLMKISGGRAVNRLPKPLRG